MSSTARLFWASLLFFAITVATNAQAGVQLYRISEVTWSVKAHGNECSAADPSPGPHCGNGASESWLYSAVGYPQGIQCNANQPRCPFESTPTDGSGNFAPMGGGGPFFLFCAPWYNWGGKGTTVRLFFPLVPESPATPPGPPAQGEARSARDLLPGQVDSSVARHRRSHGVKRWIKMDAGIDTPRTGG